MYITFPTVTYNDVNIRKRHLLDVSFQVSIKGTPISLVHDILAVDINTKGMFKKTWLRLDGELYLCKSDKTTNKINTKAEIEASNILEEAGYSNHIVYKEFEKDDEFCCICKCFTDDDEAFVEAEYIKGYLERKGIKFLNYIYNNFLEDFSDMVVIDYCLGNPDEHINNWGFIVDTETNEIKRLAPVFDNNQALIIFETHKEKEFDELIYDPTNKTTLESVKEYFKYSTIDLSNVSNENVKTRFLNLYGVCKEKKVKNTIKHITDD